MYEGLPTCGAFFNQLKVDDMKTFFDLAPFLPHASSHADIGGVYGCDVLDQMQDQGLILDSLNKLKICKKWTTVLKV